VCRVSTVCILLRTGGSHAVDCLPLQLTSAGWPKDIGEGSELLHTRSLDLLVTVLLFSASTLRLTVLQLR